MKWLLALGAYLALMYVVCCLFRVDEPFDCFEDDEGEDGK